MNLAEYQKRFGIRRIDFSKVHRTNIEEQYGNGDLICPYCQERIEYESEETDTIIRGTAWQCPECGKWFYVDAEVTVNTTCYPMEDAVINNRRYIERSYEHIDECEKKGMIFPERQYGFIEWEMYYEWAKPLFENARQHKPKQEGVEQE